jgi:hypothetical protein
MDGNTRNCIRCGRQAGYNRAVVDTVTDRELGGFCRNCEFEEFGRSLERSSQAERTCLVCDRDGHFGFATWTPTLKRGGRRLVSEVSYEVTDRTVFLCDEHFYDVRDGEGEPNRRPGRVTR